MVALVKLKRITRNYDGISALRGVSLEIKDGEILSIIGPNGSGKTTLLKILALLDRPSSGEIFYRGVRLGDSTSPQQRKKITMVFQRPALFNATVFANVAYGLALRGHSAGDISHRVERALKIVRLKGFASRMAGKLSGGEQQRVVLARAIALEPELLLLDEPTSNLDPANSAIFEKTIRSLGGKTTVVVATHNLFQAKRISDRVGCLLNGVMIDVGKTKDIFTRPRSKTTRKFISGEFF